MIQQTYFTDLNQRDEENLIWSTYYQAVLKRPELTYTRTIRWEYKTEDPVKFDDIIKWKGRLITSNGRNTHATEFGWGLWRNCIFTLQVNHANVWIVVQCLEPEDANDLIEFIQTFYPRMPEVAEDGRAFWSLWTSDANGATSIKRKLDAPKWDDISHNYSEKTWKQLEELRKMTPDESSTGKLILWHGEPGTGKTTALRSLAASWKDWCEFNFFAYPEQFFHSENYMYQVILRDESNNDWEWSDELDQMVKKKSAPWQLLVFEDAGEFLQTDAKMNQGHGLSRLLNLADGIIGQGLKVLILITTNEEFKSLHPAVTRQGRIKSSIKFTSLDWQEMKKWQEATGMAPASFEKPNWTIAELYNGAVPVETSSTKFGFS